MPATTSTGHNRQKLREVGDTVLEAAKNGSLVDLKHLSENVDKVPHSLLPKALDIFLSHLDSTILLDSRTHTELYSYVSCSFTGLAEFVALAEFPGNPVFAKRLLDAWAGIVDTLIVFYRDAEATGKTANSMSVMSFTARVVKHLIQVDEMGTVHALSNERSQIFIYILWLRDYKDYAQVVECSSLVPTCLRWGSKSLDCLLKAAGGPTPAKGAANLFIKRLNGVLDGKVPQSKKESILSAYSMMFSDFLQEPQHEIAQALVECGGIRVGMRVLRHLVRKIDKNEWTFLCASACFESLARTFDVKSEALCKAIQMGFLGALFHFSPWFTTMEANEPESLSGIRDTLVRIMPRDLIYTKTIKAMSDAMMSAPAEERIKMDKSLLHEEWLDVQMILVERLAAFRMYVLPQRIVRCDACGRRDIKTAFKRCSRCKQALYCSRACQSMAWKSSGHKTSCGNEAVDPSIKRHRITSIEDVLAIRDIQRYFTSAAVESLGSLAHFDPSKYIVQLDYSKFPVKYEILDLAEFLKTCPVENEGIAIAALASELPRTATQSDPPPRVLCAKIFGRALQYLTKVDPLDLDPFWTDASELPDGRKRIVPRAALQVTWSGNRGRGRGATVLKVDPKMDAIDHLLSACGSTLEDFWKLDFDRLVLTWRRG